MASFFDKFRKGTSAPARPQIQYSPVFEHDFDFTNDMLGGGQFGTVHKARSKHTGQEFAVKILEWRRLLDNELSRPENLKAEMALLKHLKHPGIIYLEHIFSTPDTLYLVMEYAKGGDLLDRILKSQGSRLPELQAKFFIWQILIALLYLHTQQVPIAHRDLKPENVLLITADEWPMCKLCDFGFARLVGEGSFMRSLVGTRAYVAPEVLNVDAVGGYQLKVDLWSLGVIAYVALSGTFPFKDDEPLSLKALQPNVLFPQKHWGMISDDGKAWIMRAFQVNPQERFNTVEALQDRWLQDKELKAKLKALEERAGEPGVFRLKEFMRV